MNECGNGMEWNGNGGEVHGHPKRSSPNYGIPAGRREILSAIALWDDVL